MNDPLPRKDHDLKSSAASAGQENKIVSTISRRKAIERFAFYGAAMALAQEAASAQAGSSGSFGTAAVALPDNNVAADSNDELAKAVKISRAMRAGPLEITRIRDYCGDGSSWKLSKHSATRDQRVDLRTGR